jgi:hypothetical protein
MLGSGQKLFQSAADLADLGRLILKYSTGAAKFNSLQFLYL